MKASPRNLFLLVICCVLFLGVRYSTSGLAISANRLAIPTPAKTGDGAREARPPVLLMRGRIAKRFALIAKPDVE